MDINNKILKKAAKTGDIDLLYTLLADDPFLLERLDHMRFANTPLHVAARYGKTHFAMEITNLKPSLAQKLNDKGFSPMHLALQINCLELVRGFVAIDSDLIRIKGRGQITPLHYVVQTDNVDLLVEFLSASPSCVEDLTFRCETAFHIAVKCRKLRAFRVLLGWVQRVNKEEILNWKDEDGNTVFQIGTSTNQSEVMKLLHKIVNVNAKNFSNLTAIDIFYQSQSSLSPDIGKILQSAKAKTASELSDSTSTLAGYLSQGLSFVEKRDKLLGLDRYRQTQKASFDAQDTRNAVLVVAILIATAAFQVGLNPPGGYWQDTLNPSAKDANGTDSMSQKPHIAGRITMPFTHSIYFYSINGFAFYSSVSVIFTVIIGLPYWKTLYLSTCLLLYAYYISLYTIFPPAHTSTNVYTRRVFFILYFVAPMFVNFVPWVAFFRHEKRRRQVDLLRGDVQKSVR